MQFPSTTPRCGQSLASLAAVFIEKQWVYVLQSSVMPDRHYVGLTSDADSRLRFHNEGRSPHTANDRPWRMLTAIYFEKPESAAAFERYLKSGSERAFAKRHFV